MGLGQVERRVADVLQRLREKGRAVEGLSRPQGTLPSGLRVDRDMQVAGQVGGAVVSPAGKKSRYGD